MPNVPVHDLLVHPRERDLVVGTYGRAMYITDVSVLQQLDEKVLAEDAHLFDLDPHAPVQTSGWGNYDFYGDRFVSTPNEPAGIRRAPTTCATRGTARSASAWRTSSNQLLRTITGTSQQGLNAVRWDMRDSNGQAAGGGRLPGHPRDRRAEVREDRPHPGAAEVADAARRARTRARPVPLRARGDRQPPLAFRRGAHEPYAIRWFGSTALVGHLRHLGAEALASEQLDTRDWMRPQHPESCSTRSRGCSSAGGDGATLAERLGRDVWIDFVADTADDYDVSAAVAGMVFAEYAVDGRRSASGCRAATC